MANLFIIAAIALVITLVASLGQRYSRRKARLLSEWEAQLRHVRDLEKLDFVVRRMLEAEELRRKGILPSTQEELDNAIWVRERGQA